MKHITHKIAILLIIFGLSFTSVFAQDDVTPTPNTSEVVEPIPDPTEEVAPEPPADEVFDINIDFVEDGTATSGVVNTFLNALAKLVYLPSVAGFAVVLTSIAKRFLSVPSANVLALIFMSLLWVLFTVAQSAGIDSVELDRLLSTVTELGYTLLALSGTHIASTWLYNKNKAANTPIIGYTKPHDGNG